MFYENCFPYSQPQNVNLSTTLPSPNMTYDLSTEIACQNNTQQLELEPEPDTVNHFKILGAFCWNLVHNTNVVHRFGPPLSPAPHNLSTIFESKQMLALNMSTVS